ncbi:HepT-like ribonuclease domain-containing protein [uncultured Algoriphagus sp.]|uniref:HepT-like ribonuclease domain-containing protein n=1 Tax=Algoriphagus formosus TaxID=2007308 RepID=UPI0025859329|nr:HepT-like ribonuclease domain-containing protein [uncultured Algoriphagus sp.]
MSRKIKKYLFDILTCIDEIESFFDGNEVTIEFLTGDRKTLRAVERNLEIIGEATKRLIKLNPDIPISDANEIIGARNYIAHEYESVSYVIITRTIRDHFPILKKEVTKLLEEK